MLVYKVLYAGVVDGCIFASDLSSVMPILMKLGVFSNDVVVSITIERIDVSI